MAVNSFISLDTILKFTDYPQNRNIAIGTGVPAIIALIAMVACAILFPPLSLPFLIGVGVSAALLFSLGITSVVHGARAAETKKKIEDAWDIIGNLSLSHVQQFISSSGLV